jgi:hypothetical protein
MSSQRVKRFPRDVVISVVTGLPFAPEKDVAALRRHITGFSEPIGSLGCDVAGKALEHLFQALKGRRDLTVDPSIGRAADEILTDCRISPEDLMKGLRFGDLKLTREPSPRLPDFFIVPRDLFPTFQMLPPAA